MIRVFPRRTRATPTDDHAYVGPPDLFARSIETDCIEISVTFTWDKQLAEDLAEAWNKITSVKIGGPAYGDPGGTFVPGYYLRPGYVITSRGCPSHCPHCFVPGREGPIRELPVHDGWNILDNNLLACSRNHILAVMGMAARQRRPKDWPANKSWRVSFTGGFEAARLEDWHVHLLASIHPRPTVWFAYDTQDDYQPLVEASRKMIAAGWRPERHDLLRAYVLVGHPGDTIAMAQVRLHHVFGLGMMPMAMLYRNEAGHEPAYEWRQLQRIWARPAIMAAVHRRQSP